MGGVDLKSKIREIPDYPKKGVLFYDVTTLMKDSEAYVYSVQSLVERYRDSKVQKIAAMEARGFIYGASLASHLKTGFVPIRKSGKLPADVYEAAYSLEYGENILAIHRDAIHPGERILIVDDLLATGGTAAASKHLVERLGGIIEGFAFLVELSDLNGRDQLKGCDVFSLIQY